VTKLRRVKKGARLFSILHISDLHISTEEPVDNASLIASLLRDRDRYPLETPQIRPPDAIVVSGDLIHGATIGHPTWQKEIESQYQIAEQFLADLTNRFLDGDRSRIVIIPGNHDVCSSEQ
jgi:3',5'-cyclic AMP phosphodiesterase CpdA